jgi:hypothetical protein
MEACLAPTELGLPYASVTVVALNYLFINFLYGIVLQRIAMSTRQLL